MSSSPSSLATVPNPYLVEFYALHADYDPSDPVQRDTYMRKSFALRTRYAFVVPTIKALEAIAFFSPIVEPFAGAGYWASLLRKGGVDIRASDIHVPDGTEDHDACPNATPWTITEELEASAAVCKYPRRTLLLCFPSPYSGAVDCVKAYTGKHVIYVGDEDWRLTGGLELHVAFTERFLPVQSLKLPSWRGEVTTLTVWSRIGSMSQIT